MAKQGSRLIVVSARAPFVSEGPTISRAPGGLVSALLPLMHRTGATWIAAGNERDADTPSNGDFQVVSVAIPSETRVAWYTRASTGALWPLAHGFVERCRFQQQSECAYREVNQRVADVVAARAPLRGTVWIHDYQLALVPKFVRELRNDLSIGFFWHVPWPSVEFFRTLPWRRALLEGLLSSNVVGLQVRRYVDAFRLALRDLGIEHDVQDDELVVALRGHVCRVVPCPVGIDVEAWSTLGNDADVQTRATNLRTQLGGSRLLLAVDRFDYTKGIVERLEALERLLERSVEAREQVTFVQIAVPSRETVADYRAIRERTEAIVGRISGRFGSPTRRPVHLFARSHDARELAAFYVAADVAVVTPRCDGMNLVAFEFVATKPTDRGRLVLSEMTGAADLLHDAWLVNPYDEDAMDDALTRAALSVETNDDSLKMANLKRIVTDASVDRWTSNFLRHLDRTSRSSSWSDRSVSKGADRLDKAEPRRRGA